MKNVEKLCQEYKELQRMQEAVNAEMEIVKEAIKAAMNGSETLTAGAYKIAHKLVTTSRIDTAALKKALPDIAEAFTKKTQSMRFTVN